MCYQWRLVEVCIFLGGLEAGAGLGGAAGHLAVAADDGLGIAALQVEKEGGEGGALGQGAGVLGRAAGVKASLVADAAAAAVERAAVCAYLVEATMTADGAVAADLVVIAHVDEASGQMVAPQLLGGVCLCLACRAAVDNEIAHGVGLHLDACLHACEEVVFVGHLGAGNGKRKTCCCHDDGGFKVRSKALQHTR